MTYIRVFVNQIDITAISLMYIIYLYINIIIDGGGG